MRNVRCIFFMMLLTGGLQAQRAAAGKFRLLVGVYTSPGKSEGMYVYDYNDGTGEATLLASSPKVDNPSYLAVSKDRKKLYAVSEGRTGMVNAFNLDASSGRLSLINAVTSGGNGPCYVSVDDRNRLVFAANYGGGSLSAIRVNPDGSLNPEVQTIRHSGSSVHKDQARPHVHSTVLSPDNRFLLSADLGVDKIYSYSVNYTSAEPLAVTDSISVKAGSGPRHLIFSGDSRFVYCINELDATIHAFAYKNGALSFLQSVPMLPEGFSGTIEAADLHLSPDGRYLYGTNRETSNELLIYAVSKNGRLTYAGRTSTLGKGPRNFAIDPAGNFLLVANQNTNEIVVFKRDKKTGLVVATGAKIAVDKPVCLKFVPVQ